MKHKNVVLGAALVLAIAMPDGASAQSDIKLPGTLTWTAYDVGSGGYNQAVAIGTALKNKLGVDLRVLPGKNDVSRNIPLRDGRVPFSANGVGGSYLAQEGVYEFGARDWGPQAVRSLILEQLGRAPHDRHGEGREHRTPRPTSKASASPGCIGAPSLNQNITALLAFANLTWNDVKKVEFGGFGQAMDAIIANQVDAAFSSTISGQAYKIAASPRGIRYPTFAAQRQGRLGAREQDRAVLRACVRHGRCRTLARQEGRGARPIPTRC